MNIHISGIHMDLTDAIKSHVEKKLGALEKFFGGVEGVDASVEVGKTTEHHQKGKIFFCEVHLVIPGQEPIRAREVEEDLYVAIDRVRHDLQRQLVDAKEKRLMRQRMDRG